MDHYLLMLFESTKSEVFLILLLYMVHVYPFLTIVESLPGYEQRKKVQKIQILQKKKTEKVWIKLLIKLIKPNFRVSFQNC